MIYPYLSESGQDGTVAAYEELRRHMLSGSPCGRPFGLVLIMREGIAAWIERRAACPIPPAQSAASDHAAPGPLLSEPLHAEFVRVLAGIALAAREGVRP